jgi:hypothetical protein
MLSLIKQMSCCIKMTAQLDQVGVTIRVLLLDTELSIRVTSAEGIMLSDASFLDQKMPRSWTTDRALRCVKLFS